MPSSSTLRRSVSAILDVVLPPLCLSCDAAVASHQTLCAACWSKIHFITAPLCESCGVPFDIPVGDGMQCGACLKNPPAFAQARGAMLYDDNSKKLVLSFKHGDRTHPARALASWMHRAGQEFWHDADALVPVPLHRWRLFKRRYNQAALLAQNLAALSDKPAWVDALLRTRVTPAQGHMTRVERQKNVKNAFAVAPNYVPLMQGKNIILVDDVMTTGATVDECSKVLLDAGAASVKALTLARVRGYS